jgi:DNA-directed RNA polymerase subunit RPC12/RpoP
MPKKYYCHICKDIIYTEKAFKKHALQHFMKNKIMYSNESRCPYCGMKTRRFSTHFSYYHLYYREKAIYEMGLAILCKEAGNTKILNDKDLKLTKSDKIIIRMLLKKL